MIHAGQAIRQSKWLDRCGSVGLAVCIMDFKSLFYSKSIGKVRTGFMKKKTYSTNESTNFYHRNFIG